MIVLVDMISDALGISGPLNIGFLQYDPATLAMVLAGPGAAIAEVYQAANQNSVATTMASADTELNLPFFLEGLIGSVPGLPGGGGGGGGVPPIPPGCGALGIEFILGITLLQALIRRIAR